MEGSCRGRRLVGGGEGEEEGRGRRSVDPAFTVSGCHLFTHSTVCVGPQHVLRTETVAQHLAFTAHSSSSPKHHICLTPADLCPRWMAGSVMSALWRDSRIGAVVQATVRMSGTMMALIFEKSKLHLSCLCCFLFFLETFQKNLRVLSHLDFGSKTNDLF